MTVTTSVPKAPRPDTRESRALALYRTRGAEIVRTGPHTYEVPSCSGRGSYAVDYEAESCDCPDARRHPDLNCKHLLAVAVKMAKRRGQSDRGKETNKPKRCRTCGGFGYFGWGEVAPRNCPTCPVCSGSGRAS